tara:strand:- start:19117 stop:20409 length:1293 start_codon:yes stop_codon:yes gene_type:complete
MADFPACKNSNSLARNVNTLASQCVKCGLCLPHCPTYHLTQDENESPRGRIALLQALAQEELSYTHKLTSHLDHCLSCRACERACPANVEYGALITQGRALIQRDAPKALKTNPRFSLFTLITRPKILRAMHWLAWISDITKTRRIASKLGIIQLLGLTKFDTLLPSTQRPVSLKTYYPAKGKKIGRVGLFLGCIQKMTDTDIFLASIHVLTALGYDVHIPKQQACCGAINLHSGHPQSTIKFAKSNLAAFSDLDYIVTLASGCGTTLSDYPKYFGSGTMNNMTQTKDLESFASRVVDISSLIEKTPWPKDLKIKKTTKRLAIHSPCTLKNVWQSENDIFALVQRSSEHEIYAVQSQYCCGAAGRYMFDFPEDAAKLVDKILTELSPLSVDILVTSNTGCSLHLKHHLRRKNLNISVQHPIVLLSNSIKF